MDTLMLEHGVRYGQTVTSTEVQQQNTTRVQIGEAIPLNHTPPGNTAHVGEVPQLNDGVHSHSTLQYPSQGLQEGQVFYTAVRPVSQRLGTYKQAHAISPPLTAGNCRVEESPASLKKLGSRAQTVRGGEPNYL